MTSTNVTVTLGSQASVAVAAPKDGTAGQLIVEVVAGQVMVGGAISRTTMVRLHVAVLPQSSVAVQVRVIPPWQPGVVTSLNEMATLGSQASVAVATPKLGCAGQFNGLTTFGQVMLGGTRS